MKNYALWTVNGEEYKLKLRASETQDLEDKLGTSLFTIMSDIPKLNVMLTIIHSAMKPFNHGIKRAEVNNIYDDYVDAGGSQLELYTSVLMDIFKVSGFFSSTQTEMLAEKQQEMNQMINQ